MKRLACGAVIFAAVLAACIPEPQDGVPTSGGGGGGGGSSGAPVPGPPLPAVTGMRPVVANVQLPAGIVAPSTSWVNVTSNLANLSSECGNLSLVSADPWSARMIAGVAVRGLFVSNNRGTSWESLGAGAGSDPITNVPSAIVHDPQVPGTFWETGTYHGGGAYRTTDGGDTFRQLGSITHNDLLSVDMRDPMRRTLLAGGHEQIRTIYRSTDGGASWTNIGDRLPADSNYSSYPLVLDSQNYLIGVCGFSGGACGVWRSVDGGTTWTATTSSVAPNGVPLWHSSGRIFWPSGDGLAVSGDNGVTWQAATSHVSWPVELPDGRLLGLANGSVVVSPDGRVWTPTGQPLPFEAKGLTYSAWTKTVYVWRGDCGSVVLPYAIASAGFDYQ